MIDCKTVAKLLGTDELRDQTPWTRLRLWLHLLICRHCNRLARQFRQIGAALRGTSEAFDSEQRQADLEAKICRELGLEDK
ncbi:MAG: hypothetical protein ACE5HU_10890 [Acidobacteriota bacterium]